MAQPRPGSRRVLSVAFGQQWLETRMNRRSTEGMPEECRQQGLSGKVIARSRTGADYRGGDGEKYNHILARIRYLFGKRRGRDGDLTALRCLPVVSPLFPVPTQAVARAKGKLI